jgi:hypothetical protein
MASKFERGSGAQAPVVDWPQTGNFFKATKTHNFGIHSHSGKMARSLPIRSNSMQTSFPHRAFQLWEYKVSHGSLLIRSPQSPGIPTNIDLVCKGVEYLAIPRHIHGLDLVEGTAEEIKALSQLLQKDIELPSKVRVIVSEGRRFPIVAAFFTISENEHDIFHSPFAL